MSVLQPDIAYTAAAGQLDRECWHGRAAGLITSVGLLLRIAFELQP